MIDCTKAILDITLNNVVGTSEVSLDYIYCSINPSITDKSVGAATSGVPSDSSKGYF